MTFHPFALALALALAVLLSMPLAAKADFQAGVRAYDKGDYRAAYEAWLPLARSGDPAAQRNLGHLFRFGHGVGQDFAQAADWYERAATTGLASAQVNLAMMRLRGQGVARAATEAAYWLELAARQGHILAQYNLGLLYLRGNGVAADEGRALGWLNLAAKGGHRGALELLSHLVWQSPPSDRPNEATRGATGHAVPRARAAKSEVEAERPLVSARSLAEEADVRDGEPTRAAPAPVRTRPAAAAASNAPARPGPLAPDPENPEGAVIGLLQAAILGASEEAGTPNAAPGATGEGAAETDRVRAEVARLEASVLEDPTETRRREKREKVAEAMLVFNGGDLEGARAILEPLALSDGADAQYRLGEMHAKTPGAENMGEAYVWLALAAENGHPKARRAQWAVLDAMGEAERRSARRLLSERRGRLTR